MGVVDNAGDDMGDGWGDSVIGCSFFLNDFIGGVDDIILNLLPSGIMVRVPS